MLSQKLYPFERGRVKHRISFSFLKSFYHNDPNLTANTKGKLGYNVSYKAEFLSGKKLNYTLGLDYSYQHLLFKGYYDLPGYTYLFDKTFPYSHDIQIQEILLPIGFKESIADERNYDYTPYISWGLAFRYLYKTYTIISSDSTGITVYDGKAKSAKYESNIPAKNINALLYCGLGIQHNNRDSGKAVFFEIMYKYGISRYIYYGNNNSNNLGIRNSYLAFMIGFRI